MPLPKVTQPENGSHPDSLSPLFCRDDLILLLHQNTLMELLLCAKGSVTVGNVGERTKRTPS